MRGNGGVHARDRRQEHADTHRHGHEQVLDAGRLDDHAVSPVPPAQEVPSGAEEARREGRRKRAGGNYFSVCSARMNEALALGLEPALTYLVLARGSGLDQQ